MNFSSKKPSYQAVSKPEAVGKPKIVIDQEQWMKFKSEWAKKPTAKIKSTKVKLAKVKSTRVKLEKDKKLLVIFI